MIQDIVALKAAFRSSAIARADALLESNSRVANQHYDKLIHIYQKMELDSTLAKSLLIPMLDDPNIYVRKSAAVHCLGLRLEIKRAEKVLIAASKQKDIGILAGEAEMTFKVWREKGKLILYQKGDEAKENSPKSKAPKYKLSPKDKLIAWRGGEAAMLYFHEVMNGGHWQYFENYPKANHNEVIEALRIFGAKNYSTILKKALDCKELLDEAIRDEKMTSLDNEFYRIKPGLNVIVEQYLNEHEQD